MNVPFTLRKRWSLLLLAVPCLILSSCSADSTDDSGLPTVTTINFTESTATIAENAAAPLTVSLTLGKTVEAPGTLTITLDETSTATEADFKTTPAFTEGKLILNFKAGDSQASFTLAPVDNTGLNEDLTVILALTEATNAIKLADSKLTTTIQIVDNEELQGQIKTSLSELEDFGEVTKGQVSALKSYTVSGTDLKADVMVKASENFKISLDSTTFSSSLTLPVADVNGAGVLVYVQFAPITGAAQELAGTLTHTGTLTPDVIVNVSGTELAEAPPILLIFEDNFKYGPTSGDLKELSEWENYQGDGTNIQYYPDGLSYANYPAEGGGSFELLNGSGSREDVKRNIPTTSSGSVYTAQLIKVASASGGTFFQSIRDAGGSYFNRLYIKSGTDGYNLGIARTRSGGGSETYATKTLPYNKTIIVVTKYDFNTKISSLIIIDGDIPAEEPTTPDADAASGDEPDAFVDINYRQAGGDMTARIGGLRIAPSWRDVLGL